MADEERAALTEAQINEAAQEFWDEWRARQKKPERVKLTPDRWTLIRRRVAQVRATPEEMGDLVVYFFEGDTHEAKWMQSNPQYLGVDGLLRKEKLADRIERARDWVEENYGDADQEEKPKSSLEVLRTGGTLEIAPVAGFVVEGPPKRRKRE